MHRFVRVVLDSRKYCLIFLVLALINLILCMVGYHIGKDYANSVIKNNLESKSVLFKSLIDLSLIDSVIDKGKEDFDYVKIVKPLKAVHDQLKDVRYVYTVYSKEHSFFFGLDTAEYVDTDKDGNIDHSTLGARYDDVPRDLIKAFRENKVVITDEPYTDKYGTFLSIFVPINTKTERHVLCLDMLYSKHKDSLIVFKKILAWFYVFQLIICLAITYYIKNNDRLLVKSKEQEIEIINQKNMILKEAKMSEIGKLMASINHEINNPLQIIQLYATRGLKHADNKPEEKFHLDTYVKIQESIKRITSIISFMKSLVKDNTKEEVKKVKVLDLVNNVIPFINFRVKEYSIDFKVELPEDLEINVQELQFQQVLINLLQNSMDAVRSKEERVISISYLKNENRIRVMDTGDGLPKEVLEAYNNNTGMQTTKQHGSGLGLLLVKEILKRNNMRLSYLRVDNITCFDIVLNFPFAKNS